MTITDETIDYVGILAKLELSPEEMVDAIWYGQQSVLT